MRKAYSYIRMSTERQLKGDSLRRQMELSKNYALENNLTLIESIDGRRLEDIGVSAFHGKNATDGVLSVFLRHLEAGNIERDSVLLVESLDRLSRERITAAIGQFISIIRNGVEIVTLADKTIYNQKLVDENPYLIMTGLVVMMRANEESETKSKRGRAVWAKKREEADQKIITRRLPGWLRYDDSSKKIEIIESRGAVVKRIFDLYCNFMGMDKIARTLNEESVSVFGKGTMWRRSYIKKILQNIAVYGSYQPCSIDRGRRYRNGKVIDGYFPVVVSKETFDRANANVSLRKNSGRGRKGEKVTNLFSGLVFCSSCGSKMQVVNKGEGVKGGRYLCCVKSKGRAGCDSIPLRLDKIEEKILDHLREIDYSELFGGEDGRLSALNARKLKINEELEKTEKKWANIQAILDGDLLVESGIVTFSNQFNEMQEKKEKLLEELREVEVETNELVVSKNELLSGEIKKTIEVIKSSGATYELRAAVQSMLLKVVDKIVINSPIISFCPWEYHETSVEVIKFKLIHPSYKGMKVESLCELVSFKKFVADFERDIRIFYKNGESRQIILGYNASFLNKRPF